jgi:hypothetical protein
MATTTEAQTGKRTGGYKDRPWIPRFWDGMNASGWFRLILKNHLAISPRCVPMATLISGLSVFNSALAGLQSLVHAGRIARTRLVEDPIFIIGHWRSGTTLLHEYMVLDPRHTYPDTYACFAPNHHLISRGVLAPMLSILLPDRRPIDNMPAGWDRPQEDEFALCNMGLPSPYLVCAFPNRPPQDPEYLDMEGVSEKNLARWKETFLWFLKTLTLRNPKRIVLKSPPHTARIKTLLELFPQAKFVHIYRDPFVVFPSTVNLWKRLSDDQGLQIPRYETLEEEIFETFNRMYQAFERDRPKIAPSRFAEVSYEQLTSDPVGEVRRIYEQLELGEFDKVQPTLEQYVAGHANYQRNRWEQSPELRAKIARHWGWFAEKYGYSAGDASRSS